jgi:hypothetical protein
MVSVISETRVKPGQEAAWDAAYHERAADARSQPGWVDLHRTSFTRPATNSTLPRKAAGSIAGTTSSRTRPRPDGRP